MNTYPHRGFANGDDNIHAVKGDQRTACALSGDVQVADSADVDCVGCLLQMALEIKERLIELSADSGQAQDALVRLALGPAVGEGK